MIPIADRFDYQPVAITRADGGVSILRIVARAWNSKLAPDDLVFERDVTPEVVAREINRWEEVHVAREEHDLDPWLPIADYRLIEEADLPTYDAATRDAWRIVDGRVAVDASAIRRSPEPEARDAEIADVKAAVAALKKSGVLTDAMIDAERVFSPWSRRT